MTLDNLSRPMSQDVKNVRVASCLPSKLLIITSLEAGSGDYTQRLMSFGGLASARLHLRPMFRAAQDLELNPRIVALDVDNPLILNDLGKPEICVIGKVNHFDDSRMAGFAMAVLSAVARLKARKAKIVLLYCDNLASLDCVRGQFYRDALALSDHVIVPCKAMSVRARNFLPPLTPVTVIKDPWQVRTQKFRLPKSERSLRIGWFGNANNINFLCENILSLMISIDKVSSVELVILSSKGALKTAQVAFNASLPSSLRPWSLELVQWDDLIQPRQLEDVLGSLHVVWLPSDPNSPLKGGVSHNRLVDAVRSGSIVVANKMQSYEELSQIALLGSDHGSLINRLVPQYERLAHKYEALRPALLNQFAPELNLITWRRTLNELLQNNK